MESVESSFSYHIPFGWQETSSLHSPSPSEKEIWHKSHKAAAKYSKKIKKKYRQQEQS